MLMHHTDAQIDRLRAGTDGDVLVIYANLAAIGFIKTIDDRHQGAFAGAVFADDAMNAALANGQVNVMVGLNRAKGLADSDQF